ncbi:MAG TPA: TROVE domain-containing protein [Gemmatimonadales bacterium]|nr:TROVE domain-containing protein [Gemmatimonadales bacterium]
MINYAQHVATSLRRLITPQSEPIPGTTQVSNSAGGHAWPVDCWARLDRFLILGSEGGTFYVEEHALTRENANAVIEAVAVDGPRVVQRIVDMSTSGRAPKNDPALFALAIAAGLGDASTRAAALAALPQVARTGTHLFHWIEYMRAFRGWGRSVRRAVASWYTAKPANEVAYQILKYRSRDGWAHRDALRLAHPKAPSLAHAMLFQYAVNGWEKVVPRGSVAAASADLEGLQLLEAVQQLKGLTPGPAATLIRAHGLVREMVPTELLTSPEVWAALLESMPLTAMIRNLGVMTKVGLLATGTPAARMVRERLQDRTALRRARVHPLAVLAALKTYGQGHGMRGEGAWTPVASVVDGLDAAFYLAFENVPATGKRIMLALDVSGSMKAGVHGMPYLSCREASAAMALVTAATEPEHRFTAFAASGFLARFSPMSSGLCELAISPRQRLDDVVKLTSALPFGGTDCALPMTEALKRNWPVDVFVIYTDNETWAGEIHPAQALRAYRERTGIAAKLVVVAMASNGFSIADPNDAGMLDVVGFDTATPGLIAEFVK